MPVLEIKNLKSGELHHIQPSGATLGREGAKADIQIRDPGVSKRHARIYEKGGVWYLVDMGSSNGTFMHGERLTGPAALDEGAVFGMSRHKFEVVGVVREGASGANGASQPAARAPGNGADELYAAPDDDLEPPAPMPELSPAGGAPPLPPEAPYPDPQYADPQYPDPQYPDPQYASPSLSPTAPPEMAPPSYAAPAYTAPPEPARGAAASAGDADAAKKGAKDVLIAVPKAIAFYLAAVPLLAVNPFGTVRKSIEEQKHPALNAGELISYALPANLFSVLVVSLATLIGQLVGGTFSIGALLPIVPLIVAVVSSVITGFVFHPVLGWLIRILKGQSDARSRSNYFLMLMTARVLLAIPTAIGTLLALINVPFINAIPPVLFTVSSLLTLLVAVKWLKFFDVMKPVQIVVLVLGLLGAAGTAFGVVTALLHSIDRVTSGGGEVADVGDVEAAAAAAAAAAKQAEALQAELKAKLEAGGSEEEIKALKAQIDSVNAAAANAAASAAANAGEVDAADVEVDVDVDVEPGAKGDAAPALSYGEFSSRVDKIERIVGGNPTVLQKDKEALKLYSAYHRVRHEVEEAFQKKTEKDPSLRAVHERLRDAEIYQRTANTVDALHKKLTAK